MEHPTDRGVANGCPAWAPEATTGPAERRRQKELEKRHRDASRQPDSWERFRVIMEVVDKQRNVVEIADHRARYALVILGVLNAVIFVLLGRGGVFNDLPEWLGPWLVTLLVLYAALTFLFVLLAIECLRPRTLGGSGHVHTHGIPGLLFWEVIAQHDAATYVREWETARMDQLNKEGALAAHRLSLVVSAKYRVLGWLYRGLIGLVFLCTLLLVAYAVWGRVP